jgi:hypothetical protein
MACAQTLYSNVLIATSSSSYSGLILQFDISTAAEFLRDTSKISIFEPKIFVFFALFGQFGDLRDRLEIRQRPE